MPSYIAPIEHTRSFSLKPANGLRYGNFEGVVHLPPVINPNKLGPHSISSLNNQQIYKTVCEWYESWRPWQQKVLLCGIVDRCSIRQVDILATTLEPIRHRDYTVAVNHQYPTSPLKKLGHDQRGRKKKKKKGRKKVTHAEDKAGNQSSKTVDMVDQTLDGAETPVSIIDPVPLLASEMVQKELQEKLKNSLRKDLSTIEQERTKDFSVLSKNYTNVDEFADTLAGKIIEESIPKTVALFDPSELYAQDLASSILQQALTHVEETMDEKEKDIQEKTEQSRLDMQHTTNAGKGVENVKVRMQEKNAVKEEGRSTENIRRETPPLSVLDKYRKFKSPKPDRFEEFLKKGKRPKSLVRIVVPDDEEKKSMGNESGDHKRNGSAHSGVSNSMSVVTRSSISNMRYKLFGAHSIATPDFFREDGVAQIEGGSHFLRQGGVKRPQGMVNIPIPMNKMYKSIKWWADDPGEGRIMLKAQKLELKSNFKEQLNQIWEWLYMWEEYEKIALLKELLKLCGPEDLKFFCSHLQQRLRNMRDINRMSDKLLLYIFSFLDANEIQRASRVCRRWRYMCAMDSLWMIKCHELGMSEGIKNLEKLIVKAKGYRMVIDWRMAYEELNRITQLMKRGFVKKKPKPVQKGRTVEFREEIEKLKQREDSQNEIKKAKGHNLQNNGLAADDFSDTTVSESDPDPAQPRFEFSNRIPTSKGAPRGSMSRDELHSIIKKMLFEPEEKLKKPPSRGTPMIVELEVHRGTLSAIRKKEAGDDDDHSVISEDLAEFDDEYKLKWDKKPVRKPVPVSQTPIRAVSTDGGVEVLSKSEDRFDRIKRLQKGYVPNVGPPILRRRKEMADDAGPDDAAYDIRPELYPAQDILGKAKPHMSLQWYQKKKKQEDGDEEDEDEEEERRVVRQPHFVGEVRSVLRARKLQGHMSGIMCVQFDHRRLISAGLDRVIRMWDIRSGRSLHKFHGHKGGIRCLKFYGNELATGSWDTTIMIWDLRNLCRQYILTDHTDSVTCLALSHDFMVSGSQDCTVRIWRRSSYMCCNVIRGHKKCVTSLAFDGSHVVSASKDMTLRLSNIITGDCVCVFSGCDDQILSVTMKGSLIISGNASGHIYFWNKLSGECEAAIQAHNEAINTVAFLDGRFYSGSGDGNIREWDLVTMTSVRLLQGHKGPVRDLKVTMDRMVSCSDDGSIRIWDLFDPRKKTSMDEQIQQLHQDCP